MFLASVSLALPSDVVEERPNFLVFMAEDLGMRVGAFGDRHALTPTIDKLAERGVRYTNTFTTAGVCAPSRAAHIMSVYQIAFGAQHMRTSSFEEVPYRSVPAPHLKAYPELLRQAGYFTFTVKKLDYQFSSHAPGSGPFTIWTSEMNDLDLDKLDPTRPFYGLINLPQTHESQIFNENFDRNRDAGRKRVVSPDEVEVPAYYPDTPVVREAIARQYDNIAAMDSRVASILARFDAAGLLDNTIVVWTTDHGDGLPRAKREIYDSGIHVPLIVIWPDRYRPDWVRAGGQDDRLVSFVDFGPSFLTLAGVPVPNWMDGRPVLVDTDDRREFIFAAKDRLDEHRFRERAARDKRFKYIRNLMPGRPGAAHIAYRDQLDIMTELWRAHEQGRLTAEQAAWFESRPTEELYDTLADPDEVRNLAAVPAFADELQRMRAALDDWLRATPDMSNTDEADMARSMWPDGEAPKTPPPRVEHISENSMIMHAGTEGASLAWRMPGGDWNIAQAGVPIEIDDGDSVLVKSVRYGWEESDEVLVRLR